MTRYFLDCEFIEDGHTIDLISIGIACEDGRAFYAISTEFNPDKASDWVKANVLASLYPPGVMPYLASRHQIASDLLAFCNPEFHGKPEFWGYYADYDWVVLCQLFGKMIDLPKGWPMYCMDIKQWCKQLGDPKLPEPGTGEHNAMFDALWNKQAWEFLSRQAT